MPRPHRPPPPGNPPSSNLFSGLAAALDGERFDVLVETSGCRLERIVSTGQATPPGEWLDQDRDEWVVVLRGSAALRFEDEREPRLMQPGDHVRIAANRRHRVEWTDAREPTVWLALHYAPAA
jgi:cupin 2 domain-containing protein